MNKLDFKWELRLEELSIVGLEKSDQSRIQEFNKQIANYNFPNKNEALEKLLLLRLIKTILQNMENDSIGSSAMHDVLKKWGFERDRRESANILSYLESKSIVFDEWPRGLKSDEVRILVKENAKYLRVYVEGTRIIRDKNSEAQLSIVDDSFSDERYTIWKDFLERWPLEMVKKMTLQEYHTANDPKRDNFVNWLEIRAEKLGSIWGGSAFKFGIYNRVNTQDQTTKQGYSYTQEYAWYSRFGNTPESAFFTIRDLIVKIIKNASISNYDAIQLIDFPHVVKWKIAFIYQQQKNPFIPCIYSYPKIKELANTTIDVRASEIYKNIMLQREINEDIFVFSDRMYATLSEHEPNKLSADDLGTPKELGELYSITNILQDGCFLSEQELNTILSRLKTKKNLILQGPPGTGKTWLAKRLAYAFMGSEDKTRLRSMQFHATLSYEDFVQGWRPVGEGKLDLCKGPFLELIEKAKEDFDNDYVMVIEEINRGNPAQIFGELLTLLEADKRHEGEALQLCHQKDGECEAIHIPENLHVIGTMNIADRSLAIVDFALRRRFAFITLKPHFGEKWKAYMTQGDKASLPSDFANKVAQKMETLNKHIADDTSLGEQYAIGHSYVTCDSPIHKPQEWFLDIINTEIEPLLREYWFDNTKKVQELVSELKEGI